MDKFKIDSHKLTYHPQRVADFLAGKNVYPIYAEMSPAGGCNHRCTFCALDFMGYKARFLDAGMLEERFDEMGRLGLKSVMHAGEGEPLLHKEIDKIVASAGKAGIETSFTTNAVLLTKELSYKILEGTSWIKVSLNAGSKKSYAEIHRCNERDWDRVWKNLKDAVEVRKETGAKCTLGIQTVLLPENQHEAEDLCRMARDVGLDYVVIKPYSQHPLSITDQYDGTEYPDAFKLKETLEGLNTDTFHVVVRVNAMANLGSEVRDYDRCVALPFWTYIDAEGFVWGCSVYLGDERFRFGNITTQTFEEIWTGEKRQANIAFVRDELDVSICRVNCRMDKINRYLRDMMAPPEHVNFI